MSVLHSNADAVSACPKCQTVLRVPLTAANRRARCRTCEHIFRIPTRQELLDQTVAYLMERSMRLNDETDEFDAINEQDADREIWGGDPDVTARDLGEYDQHETPTIRRRK